MDTTQRSIPHPPGETTGTGERPPQRLAGSLLAFDLAREVALLYEEGAWQQGDRNAKTLVKEPDFRIVVVALRAGARMDQHQAAGRISIQTLVGQLHLQAPGHTVDLPVGRLVSLERDVPHTVEAREERAFLLTIGWPSEHESSAE